jgi:hypothetical protein
VTSASEGLDLIRSGSEHLATKTDAALLECITEILADMQELDNPGGVLRNRGARMAACTSSFFQPNC